MAANKIIKHVMGNAMPFGEDDVDTDVIIPSKFLLTITWDEVGKGLLYPRRYNKDGTLNETSPLNNARYAESRILLAGKNFGCGSSREHAPQAIKANFDAVIAASYAGIFDGNCYAIGLPAVKVSPENLAKLMETVKESPQIVFRMDLEQKTISYNISHSESQIPFDLDDVKREGFLKGTWDERDLLTRNLPKTREVASRLPYLNGFQ